MADVTEVMVSSKSHFGSVHGKRGAFLELNLCAEQWFLRNRDGRALSAQETPQGRAGESGTRQRQQGLSKPID